MPDMGAGNRTRVLGKSSWRSNPGAIFQQRAKCSGSSSREPRGSSCGQCCTPHFTCVSSLLWSVGALPKSAGCPGLSGSGQGHTALASAQSQKPRCSFSMSPLLPCWRAHPSLASIGRITGKDCFPAKRSMSTKCSLVFAFPVRVHGRDTVVSPTSGQQQEPRALDGSGKAACPSLPLSVSPPCPTSHLDQPKRVAAPTNETKARLRCKLWACWVLKHN